VLRAYAIGILLASHAEAQRGVPSAVPVSADTPFPAGCNGTQTGRNFRNGPVEPWVAVDPRDPLHMVGVWQQDRWSNGGASGLLAGASFDGGRTWTRSAPAFTDCAPGGSRFARASDPWVSISPDGTVHFISLSLNGPNNTHALLASRSADGGLNWTAPVTIIEERGPDVFNDKETLTADPHDSRYVYAVWDRLSGLTGPNANQRGPSWFARSTDGGETWEPARSIFDPGGNAQTIGNQIVVLPDGTLVNGFMWIQNATAPLVREERLQVAIIRSPDQGLTWSAPVVVAASRPVGVSNVKTGVPVRTGSVVPAFAVDPASGALYVVWEDGQFSDGQREGIAFARSTDGGLNWSAPQQINQIPDVQAFTPAIAAARNGTLAVTYFDFRKDTDDRAVLMTSCWRLISTDGGRSWTEASLAAPFDLSAAPVTEVEDTSSAITRDWRRRASGSSRSSRHLPEFSPRPGRREQIGPRTAASR
jgi:hypothetical protein